MHQFFGASLTPLDSNQEINRGGNAGEGEPQRSCIETECSSDFPRASVVVNLAGVAPSISVRHQRFRLEGYLLPWLPLIP